MTMVLKLSCYLIIRIILKFRLNVHILRWIGYLRLYIIELGRYCLMVTDLPVFPWKHPLDPRFISRDIVIARTRNFLIFDQLISELLANLALNWRLFDCIDVGRICVGTGILWIVLWSLLIFMHGVLRSGTKAMDCGDVVDGPRSEGGGVRRWTRGFAEVECGDGAMLWEVVEVVVLDVTWSWLVFFGALKDVEIGLSITFGHLVFWGEVLVYHCWVICSWSWWKLLHIFVSSSTSTREPFLQVLILLKLTFSIIVSRTRSTQLS
jgi:hypothetical protein